MKGEGETLERRLAFEASLGEGKGEREYALSETSCKMACMWGDSYAQLCTVV